MGRILPGAQKWNLMVERFGFGSRQEYRQIRTPFHLARGFWPHSVGFLIPGLHGEMANWKRSKSSAGWPDGEFFDHRSLPRVMLLLRLFLGDPVIEWKRRSREKNSHWWEVLRGHHSWKQECRHPACQFQLYCCINLIKMYNMMFCQTIKLIPWILNVLNEISE